METAGAQCLLLAGFFEDQMRPRHNIRWYAELGASFFSRAAVHERSLHKARLLDAVARPFEPWRRRHAQLSRELAGPALSATPQTTHARSWVGTNILLPTCAIFRVGHRRIVHEAIRSHVRCLHVRVRSTQSRSNLESKSMNVRPLHDRIIIQRLEEGEQKIGGIIIPDTAKEKPQQGKVIAAGTGKVRDDGTRQLPDVKAGDLILFGKYSGQEIKLDGEEYLIMREDEVLGVIEGADAKKKK